MRRIANGPLAYLAGLLIIAGAFAFVDAIDDGPAPPAASGRATLPLPGLAGSWVGTWEDTLFFVGGEMTMEIAQVGNDVDGTGSIDLSAIGLGVETGTASGTVAGDQLDFTFEAATIGSGGGTLLGQAGAGDGTVAGALNFGDFTFEGFATDERITGIFVYDTGGAGRVTLFNTTPAAEESFSEVKDRYRDGD